MAAPVKAQCPDGTPPPCGPTAQRVPRIQVMAFSPAGGDTALAYIADALTDDVVASLRSAGGVTVLSARAARGSADYQLSGRVGGTREGVTVSARLERTNGQVAWAASRERMRRDLPSTADELSRELLQSIGLRPPAAAARRTVDPQLYDLVLRGRYQLARRTPASVARASQLFRQAIAVDSTSVLGYAWYVQTLFFARRWAFAIPGIPAESTLAAMLAAADRAVELDPSNALVWFARAQVAQDLIPTSRTSALASLRRSLALDSLQPEAWRIYSMLLQEVDDTTGAMVAIRRGIALAPDVAEVITGISLFYFWRRDFVTSLRWADSALALDPMLPLGRANAAQAAFWAGRLDEAALQVTALTGLGQIPDLIGTAIDVRLRVARGDSAGARAALAEHQRTIPVPSLHQALGIADGLVALGDTAAALEMLERFPIRGEMHFQMHLRYEPGLDPLRSLRRFQQLLVVPR